MSKTYEGGPITVTQTGATVTTGTASAQVAVPTDGEGNLPRYVRVAATGESYVKFGANPVAATGDLLVQPSDSVIVAVCGAAKMAYIQGTATAKVNIVPLANV